MTDSLSSYASSRASSPFPAYRFLEVRRVTQSAHTLRVDLTAAGWTALGGAALVPGGAGAIVIWGGLLGWLVGLVLAGVGLWVLYDLVGGAVRLTFDTRAGLLEARHWHRRRTTPLSEMRRIAVPHIPRHSQKVPYRYELLVELSTGELRPLTGETAAPTSYEREPYDALARRIHAFLGWAPYEPHASDTPLLEEAGTAAQGPKS